ncbi:HipA family kinase [Sandaracinobacter sp.]|uniref:HipA family kinase n=1 Tax=Sandaracinobacter sp. TaxID=2487581 RepID=UPI0035AFCEB8
MKDRYSLMSSGSGSRFANPLLDEHAPTLPFELAVSTEYYVTKGQDIAFRCDAKEGGTYFCKDDKNGRAIRATEWFFTRLAGHLGVPVPECRVLVQRNGNRVFGSLMSPSTADDNDAMHYLSTPQRDEIGAPIERMGRFLSGITALDLFANNPDRGLHNFILNGPPGRRTLRPIDFASADIMSLASERFPGPQSPTVTDGRFLRRAHGFFLDASLEMVDRLAGVPESAISDILNDAPAEWMNASSKGAIVEVWRKRGFEVRLSAIRQGLRDGSLL